MPAKLNPDGTTTSDWDVQLTGSYLEELGIAKNVTILAGATWVSPSYYRPKLGKVGSSLFIETVTSRKGKLQIYFYDSIGTIGAKVATIKDFSTTADRAASDSTQVAGTRYRVVVTNSDTVDWAFSNLDIFHTN